jgi:hypothetical protein
MDPDPRVEPEGTAPPPSSLGRAALDAYSDELEQRHERDATRLIERELSLREHLCNRVRDVIGAFAPDNLDERVTYDTDTAIASVTIDAITFEGFWDYTGSFVGPIVAGLRVNTLAEVGECLIEPPRFGFASDTTDPVDPCAGAYDAVNRLLDAFDEVDAARDHARTLRRDHP